MAAAPRPPPKRREVEDPNNTWDMQLMAALVGRKDAVEGAALLAKGAKIDHAVPSEVVKGTVTPYQALCLKAAATAAAMSDAADALQWAASAGADVNRPYDVNVARQTFLHHCVRFDLLDGLDRYLALRARVAPGLDLSARDAQGASPMQLAINLGKHDAARLLLRHGARHDFREAVDSHGCLAARFAANGDASSLDALLLLGDNPWQVDAISGQTLLHLGLAHPAVIDVLLDRGVSINILNAHGQSALLHVVQTKPQRLDIVDILLARGADVNLGDATTGATPLISAIAGYHTDLIRKLIVDGKADPNARDALGCAPLHWAVAARSKGVLEQLLALDPPVDINGADHCGETPLHRAASLPQRDEFLALLMAKEHTDVNAQDCYGQTPLHRATRRDCLSVVKMLLTRVATDAPKEAPVATAKGAAKPAPKKGAQQATEPTPQSRLQIDAIDKNGQTALQLAVEHGFDAIAGALIQAGASVHRPTPFGSLLQSAVARGAKALVQQLLAKGAQVHYRNPAADQTAIQLAATVGSRHPDALDIVAALIKAGASLTDRDIHHSRTPLLAACVARAPIALVDMLIAAEPTAVNFSDGRLRMPLHVAAEQGDAALVARLLVAGADVDASDDDGRRSLHEAAAGDHVDVFQILVEAGADVWTSDREGRSPLHVAVGCGAENVTGFIIAMIRARFNRNPPSASGPTTTADGGTQPHIDGAAARAAFLAQEAGDLADQQWATGLTAPDAHGLTPLLLATQSGSTSCAKALLVVSVELGLNKGKRRA